MKFNILIGGKAGQGPNMISQIIGEALIAKGYYVFYSRDYQSLIRGGHNFNAITFSDKPVLSNESKYDLMVCLDSETKNLHKTELKKTAIIFEGEGSNTFFAGRLFKALGIEFELLSKSLKRLKNYSENISDAKKGYDSEKSFLSLNNCKNKKLEFLNGTQGTADGAIKSGLEIYYAYPMTPATPLLGELASKQNKNLKVIELENEIAVANSAVGSIICGKKTMIGSSGGGFDLMTETLSMSSQAEIPLMIYLVTRPGPGTGVATYTSQGDLNLALNSGHGECFRIVVSPGDPKESAELISECFYLSNKYNTPCIFLTDKHLAEGVFSIENNFNVIPSKNNLTLKKYNSYECNSEGIATENPKIIKSNFNSRDKKYSSLIKDSESFNKIKVYGKKNSKNIIISYGSTKGAIIDAIQDTDCKFIQILYLNPFPKKLKNELEKSKKIILIENSSTGQLADLIKLNTGIEIKEKILRYDGRPFFSDELSEEIKKCLK